MLSQADLARCEEIAGNGAGDVKPFVDAVAAATGLPARLIYGHDRRRNIVAARHLVFYAAHRSGISLSAIGRAMNRDHTTVMSGVRNEAARRGEKP